MSCWRSNRASQNPSPPASKATQTRRTTRPARRDSSRQRSINLNSCSGSGGSFFSGSRASPGARAATSQLDWLISMTTINVLSGSRTARDLLRSKGLDMERSIVGLTAAMVHYFRRPPHSISPASAGEGGPPLTGGGRLEIGDRMDAAHDRLAGRLVTMVVYHLADQSEAVHDEDAVGEGDHFGHVAGDEENRGALAGDLPDEFVQVGLRLDVDADRRLVDDEDLGLRRQPFGDRNLLLISAREIAHDLTERGRANVESRDEWGDGAGLAARIDQPDGDRKSTR